MRKALLLLFATLFVCCPVYSNGEDLKVIAVVEKHKPTTKTNHAPSKIQIECCYICSNNSIELSFMSDIGGVTVSLENQTYGEIQDYVGDSSTGLMIIPVSPNSAYRMDITTENGRGYYALFRTEDNDND